MYMYVTQQGDPVDSPDIPWKRTRTIGISNRYSNRYRNSFPGSEDESPGLPG